MNVAVAGDWHANTRWAVHAIREMTRRPGTAPEIVLHAGDLGVWPDRAEYLRLLDQALADNGMELWFVDGNHEDHRLLARSRATVETPWLTPRIRWLERGWRWNWHGRTWLALGGAVSVDKDYRTEGAGWFPEEEITAEQESAVIAGGHADVLLSHDAPSRVRLPLGVPPAGWLSQIPRAEAHREKLQRICRAVRPRWIFHGHYHLPRRATQELGWGPCTVTSLDMDGTPGNWGILDTGTMRWEWR